MNILTIDLEDWFHILANEESKTEKDWQRFPSRIEVGAQLLLDLLDTHHQRATFFCLGWSAENHPTLIQQIAARGHEIATHSHMHQLVFEQTRAAWEQDLDRSIKTIQDCVGQQVQAYRAPGFSVIKGCEWVFEGLHERGVEADCSIFPARRAHGGYQGFPMAEPCWIQYNGIAIKEFPMSFHAMMGTRFVFSGGGYFRLLPSVVINRLIAHNDYVMTYFHPRDFDAQQPIMPGLSAVRRFKSYYGISNALAKLDGMLTQHNWQTLGEANAQINWQQAPIVKLF